MLPRLLLSLKNVDAKRLTTAVLVVVVIALAAYVRLQEIERANIESVYRHPRVVVRRQVVTVRGPVRIVTRTIERPSGEKETIVHEERAPVVESNVIARESTPVPLSIALARPRPDRWLLGLGNRNFSYRSWREYSVWGGRELGPLVVQVGAGHRRVETVLSIRFGNR